MMVICECGVTRDKCRGDDQLETMRMSPMVRGEGEKERLYYRNFFHADMICNWLLFWNSIINVALFVK